MCKESPSQNVKSDLLDQDKLELMKHVLGKDIIYFFDDNYVNWLKLNHPAVCPPDSDVSLTDMFSSVTHELLWRL